MKKDAIELAVGIMRGLSLSDYIIQQFERGIIFKSEGERVFSVRAAKERDVIKQLEDWGMCVFHVVPSILLLAGNDVFSMKSTAYLTVPMDIAQGIGLDDPIISEQDRNEGIQDFVMGRLRASKSGQAYAFVVNDAREIREFGDIVIRSNGNGGLRRIG